LLELASSEDDALPVRRVSRPVVGKAGQVGENEMSVGSVGGDRGNPSLPGDETHEGEATPVRRPVRRETVR
jgi:hypothetical protein